MIGDMEGLYDTEICKLLQEVRDLVHEGEDFDLMETTHSKLLQAIKQLEAEARTQPDASTRKALQSKVKQYKEDAKKVRQSFRAKKEEHDKRSLMGNRGVDLEDQRDRLMQVNKRLEDGSSSLERSRRTMMEIEETASTVTDQLAQNRATIMSTKRKLDETNSLGGQATQLLRRLERNEQFKKLFAYGAMGIVAFALLFLVYSVIF